VRPSTAGKAAHKRCCVPCEIARARNCGRFEWAVLDWNAPAIDFYRSLGAMVLPDWRIVRVVGPALEVLAMGHINVGTVQSFHLRDTRNDAPK